MARCAEKNARATWCMSTLHVAYTGIAIACERNLRKKKVSPGSCRTVEAIAEFCSDATFASLNTTTAHPLRHHWCFRQRLSCHSSLFHLLCDHVDAETDDSSEKKLLFQFRSFGVKVFPLPCSFRTQKRLQRLLTIFSLLHGTHLKIWVATDKK